MWYDASLTCFFANSDTELAKADRFAIMLQYEHKMLPPRAEMEKLEDDIVKQVKQSNSRRPLKPLLRNNSGCVQAFMLAG
jgi:hypothetical protein